MDKPSGIGMYGRRKQKNKNNNKNSNSNSNSNSNKHKKSRRTIRDMLPFVLSPPIISNDSDSDCDSDSSTYSATTMTPLKRPMAVHRLDTPTSGLVIVAKTKEALVKLSQDFEQHGSIIKTYTAIVNGVPQVHPDTTFEEYYKGRFNDHDDRRANDNDYNSTINTSTPTSTCNSNSNSNSDVWNVVNYPVGNKYAITLWKPTHSVPSLNAKDGTLTMITVQLLTGRYHQIRRHFSWVCRRPLVGDHLYSGRLQCPRFYRNGLYLCSNGIQFDHPITNENVAVEKALPKRFMKLMNGEESWALYNGDNGINES